MILSTSVDDVTYCSDRAVGKNGYDNEYEEVAREKLSFQVTSPDTMHLYTDYLYRTSLRSQYTSVPLIARLFLV